LIAFQTRFANWASTVATWLIVRETVAVDTFARRATSRMSKEPSSETGTCPELQYTLSQILIPHCESGYRNGRFGRKPNAGSATSLGLTERIEAKPLAKGGRAW
jgi:hypothetical protein